MGLFDKIARKVAESASDVAGSPGDGLSGPDASEMADPVEGWGTVAEVQVVDSMAVTYVRPVAIVIDVPGIEPYAARPMTSFPREKMPQKGRRLPVIVDRADPQRIRVLWDRVQTSDAGLAEAKAGTSARREGGDDLVGQLERLGALQASGAITEEEFAALKARIIAG